MAIPGIDEETFRSVIAENLTPSDEIRTPERLFGRLKTLTTIDRALNSPGRQVFVYGDRGVGKSSLALTAAYLHTKSEGAPIYVSCGTHSNFASIMQAIGRSVINVVDQFEKAASGRSLNIGLPLYGSVGFSAGTQRQAVIGSPQTIDEALDIVRYVAARRKGSLIIIIDEMERLESASEREKFAEFIKNVPSLGNEIRFIFGGIASDVDELLNAHPSAGRKLEAIKLDRLHHSDLWQIITTVSDKLGLKVDNEMLIRISQISDGFPHFVHLIGDTLFWTAFDDPQDVQAVDRRHFREAIKGALARTDVVLRKQYQRAVEKTKHTLEYEEALWSLADRLSDRRQLQEIYDVSYQRIMQSREGRSARPKDTFNQRLLSLRLEGHGRIIVGHGAGWYSFRENLMRGYVRLQAENQQIELGRDI